MSVQQQDPLLSIPEAADYLGVGVRWMRRAVAERSVEHVKVGGLVRFRQSVLDTYLAAGVRRQVIVRTRVVTKPTTKRRTSAKAAA
jgi:excisionase family DNA binding protein